MSALETLAPGGDDPRAADRPKRGRFAGVRAGTWLFAASFSIGIWGLALKIMAPSHPPAALSGIQRHVATSAVDPKDDGGSTAWSSNAASAPVDYPVASGGTVVVLTPPDEASASPN